MNRHIVQEETIPLKGKITKTWNRPGATGYREDLTATGSTGVSR